jgi:hypothetical protein
MLTKSRGKHIQFSTTRLIPSIIFFIVEGDLAVDISEVCTESVVEGRIVVIIDVMLEFCCEPFVPPFTVVEE